jgi:staphylococcal nuclease domain-containing protein 1
VTAVRHKKDDENRSPDYDKFIIAEKASVFLLSLFISPDLSFSASDDARGMHSGKEQPVPRIGNASEVIDSPYLSS